MNTLKIAALSLTLVAGLAAGTQAQTMSNAPVPGPSIAALPPADAGPRPSSHNYIPPSHAPVVQSGNYPGPQIGATNGSMPPLYQKPADWDKNVAMHPYTSGEGPKAH